MGLFSSIGKAFNDITGATGASGTSYGYSRKMAAINNAYQKEAAQNAHQWEMADLKKAGLNPALTATGGSGASLSGGGGATIGSSASGLNPMSIISELVNMRNQTNATESQTALNSAEALRIIQMLPIEKREKEKYIDLLIEQKKYTGYFPTTIGSNSSAFGFGGGAQTTVYSKGGTVRINPRKNKKTSAGD